MNRFNGPKTFLLKPVKHALKALGYGIIGGLAVLIVILVMFLNSRPDLRAWHKAELDAEFTADSPVKNFQDYLDLEKRLFEQLQERVLAHVPTEDHNMINRFQRGSLSDPGRWPVNWNRTFELAAEAPRAGILMLHGMSDSPYSLRSLGRRMHEAEAWVIGLRLPGHGTAPAGLTGVKWEDMAAAVKLAMSHLKEKVKEGPLFLVGYSNGGALAVHYALSRLEDKTLPEVNRIVLISPSIGVSSLATLAKWQLRLGHVAGLEKLEWNSLLPEYDPFKYNSFAMNAAHQVYRITNEIQLKLQALGAAGALKRFPPLLAFQSVVDATVSTDAVIKGLFNKLPAGGHELVLFDINRISEVEQVLKKDPGPGIMAAFNDPERSFAVSLVTNADKKSRDTVLLEKKPGAFSVTRKPLGLKWPASLYSLSHVALPFPVDDPLYGMRGAYHPSKVHLGKIGLRGERGVLQVAAADMLRLRCNPFYPFMERRLMEFFDMSRPRV